MKLLSFLSNKKDSKKIIHQSRQVSIKSEFNVNNMANQEQTETLIQIGRKQFQKLEELGLKIPIAVI